MQKPSVMLLVLVAALLPRSECKMGVVEVIKTTWKYKSQASSVLDRASEELLHTGSHDGLKLKFQSDLMKEYKSTWLSFTGGAKVALDYLFNYNGREAYVETCGALVLGIQTLEDELENGQNFGKDGRLEQALREVVKQGMAQFNPSGALHKSLAEFGSLLNDVNITQELIKQIGLDELEGRTAAETEPDTAALKVMDVAAASGTTLGLIYACASAVFEACHDTVAKQISKTKFDQMALAFKAGLTAVFFFVSFLFSTPDALGVLHQVYTSSDFLKAWLVSGSVNVLATQLQADGMKVGTLSDTVPFLSISPIFLIGSGYIFLNELPNLGGICGVVIISLGGFWLGRFAASKRVSIWQGASEPTGSIALSRSVRRLTGLPKGAPSFIFVAAIQSVSSAFDKRGVRAAPPILYGATISTTVFFIAMIRNHLTAKAVEGEQGEDKLHDSSAKKWGLIISAWLLKMGAYWSQLKANEYLFSANISAIRKSSVLLTLLSARLIYDEAIGKKIPPVCLILVGVVMIVILK